MGLLLEVVCEGQTFENGTHSLDAFSLLVCTA